MQVLDVWDIERDQLSLAFTMLVDLKQEFNLDFWLRPAVHSRYLTICCIYYKDLDSKIGKEPFVQWICGYLKGYERAKIKSEEDRSDVEN